MPSNPAGKRKWRLTLARRYGLLAAAWLIVITLLHCSLNMHRQDRDLVRMGYMPVVTNLAAPLLDFVSRDKGPYRFEAIKFASFAEKVVLPEPCKPAIKIIAGEPFTSTLNE